MPKKKFNPALGDLFSDSEPTPQLQQKSAEPSDPPLQKSAEAVPSWAIPIARENRTKRVQLLFPPSLVAKLKTLADANGISMNHLIISILEAHLDTHAAG